MHEHMYRMALSVCLAFVLMVGIAACAGDLPNAASMALREKLESLAGGPTDFELLRVQKVPEQGDDYRYEVVLTSRFDQVSGCPLSVSGEEAWCVVIDRGVPGDQGEEAAHFLLIRQGTMWSVEPLLDGDSSAFDAIGCTIWYPDTSQE